MPVDRMGCVAQAKIVFHRICKNIEFVQLFLKIRLPEVICDILPCALLLHILTPNNNILPSLNCHLMMFS